jgi:hypothetical protein
MARAGDVRSLVLVVLLAAASVAWADGVALPPGGGSHRPGPLPSTEAASAPPAGREAMLEPGPVFIVAGLRVWASGQWWPVPAELPTGVAVEFAAEVRNVGTTGGTAVLTAAGEVWPLDESPAVHVMSGAATVVLAAGAAYFLELEPPWLPLSAGSYRIVGSVAESGVEIGDFSETVQVLEGADPCAVPVVDLP